MCIDCGKILTFILNLDWSNFISTLVGAFMGAFGAYCFNLKQADKQQKETEKAKLLKLFYDINVLIKIFVYYHDNIVAEIGNQTGEEIQSITPITIKDSNFNIDEYGFLTQYSPMLYEILTYVHHDINYIYEQQDVLTEFITQEVKLYIYLNKLEHIKASTVKLLAKLFVSLININNALIKFYKCENLIKDDVVNAYLNSEMTINSTITEYKKILNDKDAQQQYDVEQLETYRVDLGYIKEILETWVINFGLKDKQKALLETEIKERVKKKQEAAENDL